MMKHLIKPLFQLLLCLLFFTEGKTSSNASLSFNDLEKTDVLQLHQKLQNATEANFSFIKRFDERYALEQFYEPSAKDNTPTLLVIMSALTNRTNLTRLSFRDLRLSDLNIWLLSEIIKTQQQLQSLEFFNVGGLTEPYLRELLGSCKNCVELSSLNLKSNNIGPEEAQAISQNSTLTTLSSLNLAGNNIGPEGAQAISQSFTLTNLSSLNLAGNNIGPEGAKAISQNSALSNLTDLNLANNMIVDSGIGFLATSEMLVGLTSLDLSDNLIYINIKPLINSLFLTNLKKLNLKSNNINPAVAIELASIVCKNNDLEIIINNNIFTACVELFKFPLSLQSINLSNKNIGYEEVKALICNIKYANLTSLDLSLNKLDSNCAKTLAYSTALENLLALNLANEKGRLLLLEGNNSIGDEGIKELAASTILTNLQSIFLTRNNITDNGFIYLTNSKEITSVTTLDLEDNNITGEAFKDVKDSNIFCNLTLLDLSGNNIKEEGLKNLIKISAFSKLKSLSLARNHIHANGINFLSNCTNLSSLMSLNLAYCNAGDNGLIELLSSLVLTNLTSLIFKGNQIYNISTTVFHNSAMLTNLRELNLASNNINSAHMSVFANCILLSNLKVLDLSGNSISSNGAQVLADTTALTNLIMVNLEYNGHVINIIRNKFNYLTDSHISYN